MTDQKTTLKRKRTDNEEDIPDPKRVRVRIKDTEASAEYHNNAANRPQEGPTMAWILTAYSSLSGVDEERTCWAMISIEEAKKIRLGAGDHDCPFETLADIFDGVREMDGCTTLQSLGQRLVFHRALDKIMTHTTTYGVLNRLQRRVFNAGGTYYGDTVKDLYGQVQSEIMDLMDEMNPDHLLRRVAHFGMSNCKQWVPGPMFYNDEPDARLSTQTKTYIALY